MLEGCTSAKERWGGVHKLLDTWLHERHELVLVYMSVNGIEHFKTKSDVPVEVKIRALCEILMDYCSAGHFEIYPQLLSEAEEFNDGSSDVIAKTTPKLEENTQLLVDFNDKYENTIIESDLSKDLAYIGEILASRFEVEDQLIKDVHEAHRKEVA
jgi:regulator of sigma D